MNNFQEGDYVSFYYKEHNLQGRIVVKMGNRFTIKDIDDGTLYSGITEENIIRY